MAELNEDVFFAEKVVDSGFGQQDGKRYYKVKWTRYTWEQEDTISIKLKNLLDQFWEEHGGDPSVTLKEKLSTVESNSKDEEKPSKEELTVGITSNIDTAANNVLGLLNAPHQDNVSLSRDIEQQVSSIQTTITTTTISSNTTHNNDTTHNNNTPNIVANTTGPDIVTPDIFTEKGVKFMKLDKHTCEICYRSYSSAQSLKTHRKTHQPERNFQCETCLKSFAERSTLKRHMFIHLEEKPFKCPHCDRAFSDKSTLRRHIITHTGAKRFACSRCDKRFTRNEHLRQHMFIHTAEKLYECEICHKSFRQRSTRKNHMLLHRAETGFKCETCGDVFVRQTLYDKHVLWCTGTSDGGFKCEQCDKRFQNTLKRHEMIHTDEKPFKCQHCDLTFNDRSVLRRHTFTHNDSKQHQCNICHKDFARKSLLTSHVASQHPSSEQTVFELVQPYNLSEGISLNGESLNEHVQFVMHNLDSSAESTTVDVTSTLGNDGVSMLAQAVCNDVLQGETNVDSTTIGNKMQTASANRNNDDGQPLQLQLDQGNALQPGENQLLQVQIIRMDNGNQFVQSIQAIVQADDKEFQEPDIVVDESHVMSINESATPSSTSTNPMIIGRDAVISTVQNTMSNSNNTSTSNVKASYSSFSDGASFSTNSSGPPTTLVNTFNTISEEKGEQISDSNTMDEI